MSRPLAYLVSRYPAVSHTFIAREIDALRVRGFDVRPFSIRATPPEDLLTDSDRRAAGETGVLLPTPFRVLGGAHLRALAHRPRRYVATLVLALRLSPGGARATLWQLFYFAEAMILSERLRRERIDHVHAHFANVASAVALLWAHHGGGTWSFTMHGPTEFDDVSRHALAEKVRRATFVACIGDYCRSQLMKLVEPEHWSKLEIVHCGVDPSVYAPVNRLGRDSAALHVLCVGRLVADKGQAILLHAGARLTAEGRDVTITFVGEGPRRADLTALAQRLGLAGSTSFAGAVGQDRIRELYAAADVFCLPSFAEGVPVVLMEAMATGLPVVSSRIMGIPELVQDEVSGLLVVPGRSDALAAALRRLADDPGLRARMGLAGRDRVVDAYDVGHGARSLAEVYGRHVPAVVPPLRQAGDRDAAVMVVTPHAAV